MMRLSVIVARKEIREHLRDTRSFVSTVMYALIGPAAIGFISVLRPALQDTVTLWSMASVFALVSACTGGMNVALDATAGERDRRSLVPLLLTPADRRQLIIGKWMAAAVFGLISLGITILGCGLVLLQGSAAARLWASPQQVIAWLAAGLVPVVLLGAACHLLIAVTSASTKEAHTWMSSAVFVPMFAGLGLAFAPGLAGWWWPLVPLAGQQVWISRTITGQTIPIMAGLVVGVVTIAVSLPPLWLAYRTIDRDDQLGR